MRRSSVLFLFILLSFHALCAEDVQTYVITAEAVTDKTEYSYDRRVIDVSEMNVSESDTLEDLLAQDAQVTLISSGSSMMSTTVSLRGSDAEHVVIFVDGRRVNSLQTGSYDLSAIPLYNVQKVEILQGGMSAAYGENAIGGVINIITKEGREGASSFSADVSYGSFQTVKGSAYLEKSWIISSLDSHPSTQQALNYPESSLQLSFGAYGESSDGDFTYTHELTQNEQIRINAGGYRAGTSGKLDYVISKSKDIGIKADFQLYTDEKGVPGTVEFPLSDSLMSDDKVLAALSFYAENNPVADLTADISVSSVNRTYDPDTESTDETRFDHHYNDTYTLSADAKRTDVFGPLINTLSLHTDIQLDSLVSTALETPSDDGTVEEGSFSRFHTALAVHDELSYEKDNFSLSFLPSLRYENSEITDEDSSYLKQSTNSAWNIGFAVNLGKSFSIRANTGTSFRVPSFDDLFWSSTAFAVGNPYLEDETAETFDIKVDAQLLSSWSVMVSYFSQNLDNMILWSPSPTGQWSPDNIGEARKRGVDISTSLSFPFASDTRSSVKLKYSYLDCVDMTEGTATYLKTIPYIPKHTFSAFVSLDITERVRTTLSVTYTGYRYLTAENTKIIPSYTKVDLSASWQVTNRWKVLAGIDNLLDQQYYDIQFYPVPGISARISVNYTRKGVSK
ncbi:MAG: TonB-dependent receptor [Sphaerochaetaceae bacterium]